MVSFYLIQRPNNKGLYLTDMWCFSNQEMEIHHDYIQWMFPTDERSRFVWNAPVLSRTTIGDMASNPQVIENAYISAKRFLLFLGFYWGQRSLVRTDDWEKRSANWLTPNNHNFKRISRFLRFCSLMCMLDVRDALLHELNLLYNEHPEIIGKEAIEYWNAYGQGKTK